MEIGKQIRRRRTELNLSRGELANKIHVTPSAIANYENGVSYPKPDILVALMNALDIDCFTELFDITDKDVMGNQAPWDFDVSVKDIYSGLKTGATVQIIPKQLFSFPMKLIDYLIEREVTTLVWAVSAL